MDKRVQGLMEAFRKRKRREEKRLEISTLFGTISIDANHLNNYCVVH